jgi:hypothetical protein
VQVQNTGTILRRINRELDYLDYEVEYLLEHYLVTMLHLCHKRLMRGMIELPQYYRDTQMLQDCIERFKETRGL